MPRTTVKIEHSYRLFQRLFPNICWNRCHKNLPSNSTRMKALCFVGFKFYKDLTVFNHKGSLVAGGLSVRVSLSLSLSLEQGERKPKRSNEESMYCKGAGHISSLYFPTCLCAPKYFHYGGKKIICLSTLSRVIWAAIRRPW
jgi:hypothetical protein